MRKEYLCLVVALSMGIAALPASAIRSKNRAVHLDVYHEELVVKTVSSSGTVVDNTALAATMPFDINQQETVSVRVVDPNPLLFIYTWKGVTRTKTADYAVIEKLAETVGKFTALLPKPQRAALDGDPCADQTLVARFNCRLDQLKGRVEEIPDLVEKSASGGKAAEEVKVTVEGWQLDALLRNMRKDLDKVTTCQFSRLATRRASAENTGTVNNSNVSRSGGGTTKTSPGTSSRSSEDTPSMGSAGDTTVSGATGGKKGVSSSTSSASTGAGSGQGAAGAEDTCPSPGQQDFEDMGTIKDLKLEITQMMQEAETFLTAARGIHVPLEFEPIGFSATEDAKAKLEISSVPGREELATLPGATGATPGKKRTGDFEFQISPASPAHFSIGAAALYSFIEAPEFGTKMMDGKLKIVRTDSGNSVNGTTVGAMLSITPEAWSNPIFGGSLQIGLSPVKDKLGVFLGGALNLLRVTLGAGVAYQQTQRLAGDLREGQEIESADKLKTNTAFKPGLYLSLGVRMN